MFKKMFVIWCGMTPFLMGNPSAPPYQTDAGSVTVTGIGTSTVTVNANATTNVIKWNDFSINNGENVLFTRTGSSAPYYVVNKITGGGVSTIGGNLTSGDNGNIYLINDAGIIVTPTGNIVTGGFLASTLDLVTSFAPGADLEFAGASQTSLINNGTIQAINGDLYLIGYRVSSAGSMIASGAAAVGAGVDILLKPTDSQRLYIVVSGTAGTGTGINIASGGTINGESTILVADGNPYTLAINLAGAVTATTCVSSDGSILLIADPKTNQKGAIEIASTGSIERSTTSGTGPELQIYGNSIAFDTGSIIDVSGDTGGANIQIGESSTYITQNIYVAPGASISSNGLTSSNGGSITMWANESILDLGTVSSTGSGSSGSGGAVSMTSLGYFGLNGTVNLSALGSGTDGTLTIYAPSMELGAAANYGSNFAPPSYTITNVSPIITPSSLQTILGLSNVVVNANGTTAGSPTGDIALLSNITWSSGNSLSLIGNNAITLPYLLTMTGTSSASNTILTLSAPEITVGNALQTQTISAGAQLTTGGISVTASNFLGLYGGASAGITSVLSTGSGAITTSFGNELNLLAGNNAGANANIVGTAVTINAITSGTGNILIESEDCSQAFINGSTVNIGNTREPQNITLIGGMCSSDNESYIGSLTAGSNILIDITGNLTLTGGSSGSGNKASVVSSGGNGQTITISAFDIILQGGSGGSNNSARISSNGSNGIVNLTAGQDISLTGGGSGTTASTAHILGNIVSYTTGRDMIISGGTGLLNQAYIQGYAGVNGSVGRNQTMTSGNASLTSAEVRAINGNITIRADRMVNITAGGPGSQTQAAIYTNQGTVNVSAAYDINLTSGLSTTSDAYINSGNGSVGVVAGRDLTLTGSCTVPNEAYIESTRGLNAGGGRDIIRRGNTAISTTSTTTVATVSASGKYLVFGCAPSGGPQPSAQAPVSQYYKYYFLYELFYRLRDFNYYDWYLYHSQDFWTNANYTDP